MDSTRLTQALSRQEKGLQLLNALLAEEYDHLRSRKPDLVFQSEFSIQELLRQIAVEWDDIKEQICSMAGRDIRLKELVRELAGEAAGRLEAQIGRIDAIEKRCAAQASMNAEMALALVDQGQGVLDFLCRELKPKSQNTYSAKGRWNNDRGGPGLIKGNL